MPYKLHTEKTWYETMRELSQCFRRWGVSSWEVVPTREPARRDPQSVRLVYRNGDRDVTLEMDRQSTAADNLRVLFLAVDAMRLNDVRGIGDVVRAAYLQLAAPAKARDPYEVLGVRPDADMEIVLAAHRALAKRHHPDAGGTVEAMTEINAALDRIRSDRA